MTINDAELLRQFAREQSQDAFTALVRRHMDLVYSTALRQVRSPQLAEEVAQSVFADLARGVDGLKPDTILTAWLYQVTRRMAIDVVRRESRRQFRERIAVELADMNSPSAEWRQLEPFLDEAMDALEETDRAAILLRYFDNKSLREVGLALGASDDAAQKRVTRAVDRLHEFFAKRGIAIGAGGLVALISANAVHAAPTGLAIAISAAAILGGTTLVTTATATATKAITMTALQKTAITVALVTLSGLGVYEAHQAAILRKEYQALQKQQATLAGQIVQLTSDRDDAVRKFATLQDENRRLNSNATELLRLRGEVGVLRQQTNQIAQLQSENSLLRASVRPQTTNATAAIRTPPEKMHLNFAAISVPELLDFYAALGHFEVDADQNVRTLNVPIRLITSSEVTQPEAIRLVEKALLDQAGIEITHPQANRAVLRLRH